MKLSGTVEALVKKFYRYPRYKAVPWETKLQFYDALYHIDPEIHIDCLIEKLADTRKSVIVPDVRYANEVKKLKDLGFTIVRISQPAEKRRKLIGMKTAAKNSVLVNEYFNTKSDAYPVDRSLINASREGFHRMLDKLVADERERLNGDI